MLIEKKTQNDNEVYGGFLNDRKPPLFLINKKSKFMLKIYCVSFNSKNKIAYYWLEDVHLTQQFANCLTDGLNGVVIAAFGFEDCFWSTDIDSFYPENTLRTPIGWEWIK